MEHFSSRYMTIMLLYLTKKIYIYIFIHIHTKKHTHTFIHFYIQFILTKCIVKV